MFINTERYDELSKILSKEELSAFSPAKLITRTLPLPLETLSLDEVVGIDDETECGSSHFIYLAEDVAAYQAVVALGFESESLAKEFVRSLFGEI